MRNCLNNAKNNTNERQKYNKNVHKKYGWRGGLLLKRSEKGMEGHFQTAFTVDREEKYQNIVNGNKIPAVLDLIQQRRKSV